MPSPAKQIEIPKNAVAITTGGGRAGPQIVGYRVGDKTYDAKMNPTNAAAKTAAAEIANARAAQLAAHPISSDSGGGLFGDISSALTNVLQPVEKAATSVASNPQALTAIALAVAIPGIGAAIGESLMAAGVVTSAEAATTLGTAIASTAAQVAQGTPVDKAITNTLVNVGVSQVSPAVAQEINSVIGHPAVSDAITVAAASGVRTAAAGGSSEDITTAMTAGLAGSAANSAYSSAANDYNSTTGKVLGSATAGAVTGGAAGALNNALTTAASSIGTPKPLGDISTKPVAVAEPPAATPPVEQVAATPSSVPSAEDFAKLIGAAQPPTASLDTGVVSDAGSAPPIDATKNIPPSPVAGLDITQDQSAAETARLAAKNAELAAATTTPAPSPDQAILDLIAEKPAATDVAAVGEAPPTPDKTPVTAPPVEAPVTAPPVAVDANIPRVEVSGVGNIEPPQGAYLPDTVPAKTTAIEPAPVAEGYSTSMPDQSPAETARLAEKEQQILDLITPPPVVTEPAPAPAAPDIPAADPMSQDPAQKAQAAADVPAVEVAPSTGTGLIDTPPVPAADKKILDLIAETPDQSEAETARLAAKEAELAASEKGAYLPDSGTDTKTTTYKPDLFTTTYLSPKTKAAAPVSTLGAALGTTGLTAYRGAGEIEGTGSGKPRKNVWNVESLKLKDALGV